MRLPVRKADTARFRIDALRIFRRKVGDDLDLAAGEPVAFACALRTATPPSNLGEAVTCCLRSSRTVRSEQAAMNRSSGVALLRRDVALTRRRRRAAFAIGRGR